MTAPGETPSYREQAHAEIAKARAVNDKRAAMAQELRSFGRDAQAAEIDRETAGRSLEIAEALTRLAAIEAGLPPCYHPLRPAQEETP